MPETQTILAPAVPVERPQATRIGQLDGIRTVAFLMVFVDHLHGVPLLWMGVDIFFVLSGFLITGILLRSRPERAGRYFGRFYARRARRILVPYGAALLLSSLFFGWGWERYWYWYVFYGVNIGIALGQMGHASLSVLWSLGVEEQYYLFWPLVVRKHSEKALLWGSVATIALCPILRAAITPLHLTGDPIAFIRFLTPFRMDTLCAGAVLAILWRRRGDAGFTAWVPVARAALLGTMALVLYLAKFHGLRVVNDTPFSNAFIYSAGVVMAAALLVMALGNDRIVCPVLRLPAMRYLGVISYTMYLVHFTFLYAVREHIASKWWAGVVALGLTVAFASASWFGYEKRMLKPRRRHAQA